MRLVLFLFLWLAPAAMAADLNALARLLPGAQITETPSDGLMIDLPFSQPVPYRIYHLDTPMRLVLEFNEVEFAGQIINAETPAVTAVRAGAFQPGWSRLVLTLSRPLTLDFADLTRAPDGTARLQAAFTPTEPAKFAADARSPAIADRTSSVPPAPRTARKADEPLFIMLDPGHGGIDPGAEADGDKEADLMLIFARELKEALLRAGGFEVALTRDADMFVPLETRVSLAHQAGAHVLLSLHADVVTEGAATGLTIYTLSADASDLASQKLAERHDREDLLAGVDLRDQDDQVALLLMDMARTDTAHRTGRLARALEMSLGDRIELYKHPVRAAGFSVLKAPDIPSILIELGFMSSSHDLENLRNPAWREKVADGIVAGLAVWGRSDLAESALMRQ